jgi:hypothetical protein
MQGLGYNSYSSKSFEIGGNRDSLDGLIKNFEFGTKRVREHFEDVKGFLAYKKMDSLKQIEQSSMNSGKEPE